MKKKGIIATVIVLIVVTAGVYLLSRPKPLGSMHNSYSEQTTTVSDIAFLGDANQKIRFSFRSDIVSGDLDIILSDSAGNEVYMLDQAGALEKLLTLDSSDTYTLTAKCTNFVGKYEVSVYKAD
ncbi:MAG: hypothetical protein HFF25_10080 [Oscillospiraceae bacterium]|jgi:hypothetical protein|nr:hypothetical protein [Oscillospiraceae bacterium]MCI9289411.1 hypothetical protein [Oscillospiraceae bacterium]MCI9551875.1 hypothetical protein [Oscillospiraceae bacterium]